MKMISSTKIYFLSIGFFSLASPVFSENEADYEVRYNYAQGFPSSVDFSSYGDGYVRFDGRYRGGRGVGYKNGYASVDLFAMPFFSNQIYPFFDFQWHYTGEKQNALNVGIGTRYLWEEILLGANIFYDTRKADRRDLQQIGFGLEGFAEQWDFRANGYFPLKTGRRFDVFEEKQIEVAALNPEGIPASVNITNIHRSNIYRTFSGGNLEIGRHFEDLLWCRDIYVAGLPYYYTEKKDHFFGGAVYLQSRINSYICLDFEYSYDHHFKSRVSGQITLSYAFGKGAEDPDCTNCYYTNRLFDRVFRNELIVYQKVRYQSIKKQLDVPVKVKAAGDPLEKQEPGTESKG